MNYDDWKRALAGVPLPAAVVDLDAFDRNVDLFVRFLESSGGRHSIRLASKSVRVPALMRRVLDRGAPFRGLMCYTPTEAEFLAQNGFDDLLVAYPTHQANDLASLRRVHESGKTIRQMVDSVAAAQHIAGAMQGVAKPFEIVLDIDMSLRMARGGVHLGVRRSPIRSAQQVLDFFRAIAKLPSIRCRSLMGYEAQVAGIGDDNPFKRSTAPILNWVRSKSITRGADLRREITDVLREDGFEIELFNGGGSGSILSTAAEPWLTEVTVGSGLLCSHLFSYYRSLPLQPACFFVLQACRASDPGYVTCSGGGYIASGEPGWEKVPVPYLPAGLRLVSVEGCGEVQTPVRVPKGTKLAVGDPVLFRHAKAGELAEHFNSYRLVENGAIIDEVPTYRGLGQCFLG